MQELHRPTILNQMVKFMGETLDSVFHALSDPTRRELLDRLRDGERSVSSLARPFAMSLPAVSKHLRVLEDAALVRREKRGRVHFCQLEPAGLDEISRWLDEQRRFWEERLDALERHLGGEAPSPRRRTDRRESGRRRPE